MYAVLLLSLLFGSTSSTLPDLPDTPAGQAAAAFLDAMDAGDEDALRAFVERHLAPSLRDAHSVDGHLSMLGAMAADLGGAAVLEFEEGGPYVLHVTLLGADGAQRALTFRASPEPPHGLAGIEAAEVVR